MTADDDDDVVWELETPLDEHLLVWDPDEEEDDEYLPAPVRTRRQRKVRRRAGGAARRQPRVVAGLIAVVVLVLLGVALANRGSDPDADTQDVASAEEADDDRGFTARSTTTRDPASTSTTTVDDTTTTTTVPDGAPGTSIVPTGATPAAVDPGGAGGEPGATTIPPTTEPDPDDGSPVEGTHVSTGISPGRIAAGEAVEVRWRQSSASGITFATFLIEHEATGNHLPSSAACPSGNDTPRWAGTAHDASFVVSCRTPAGAASGRYTVFAHLEHADGSVTRPVVGSLEITGGPADTSPPVLVSSTVSPASGASGATVTLRWRFSSPAGMHFSSFFLRSGDEHVAGGPDCPAGGEVPLHSGTVNDATYRATCNTAGLGPGTYEVEVYAQDQAGNVVVAPAGTLTVTAP